MSTDISTNNISYEKNIVIISKPKNKIPKCNYTGCKKKLKLSDMPCKCTKIFCRTHRLPSNHLCEINYLKITQNILSKNIGDATTFNKISTI
jgi:predicted nucleic acid binding AN1-type Zn finger protein